MHFFPTAIPEVIRIEPQLFGDARGFFMETFRADQMAAAGITTSFVQDNHSSSLKNILRGLHYQIRHAQGKLVRAVNGCGCRFTPEFIHFWPLDRRNPLCRQQKNALDPPGICAWLLCPQRLG
jgi:hypothetical protein